jgi:hypothetical protein
MEKEGYETVLATSSTFEGFYSRALIPYNIVRVLDKKGSVPIGMVRVNRCRAIRLSVGFALDCVNSSSILLSSEKIRPQLSRKRSLSDVNVMARCSGWCGKMS